MKDEVWHGDCLEMYTKQAHMKNTLSILTPIAIFFAALAGEVLCIYKAVKCNWEPVGKAEVIYTAAAVTGLGAVVGWIDIEDK